MSASESTPLEIELKFSFAPEARARIEAHPVFRDHAASGRKTAQEVSTYYDTPDRTLAREGLSLRVRVRGRGRTQTLKSDTGAHGVAAQRGEWEWAIRSSRPDATLLLGTPAAAFASATLVPVVVTDIERTVCRLSAGEDAVVEAALDEGRIQAGERECSVHELELELKSGSPSQLYQWAVALQLDLGLRLEPEAKATRGYRLLTGEPPSVRKVAMPQLDRHVTAVDGLRQLLSAAMGGLVANQPAAAAGDPEGVHQMRIALRRLRTILVLFKPHLEPHATMRFEDELRRLGHVLGDARDWDVFMQETLPEVGDPHRGLLTPAADAERQAKLQSLRQEFERPNLTALVLSLAAWAEDATLMTDETARTARLADVAPALLGRLARKVAKRGRHIAKLSGPELHDVRKALKKLRYATDDLAGLYPGKRVKSYRKHCKGMQDELGSINDAAMAISLAESLMADGQIARTPAAAAVAKWGEKQRHKALRKLPDDWKQFRHAAPFWQ